MTQHLITHTMVVFFMFLSSAGVAKAEVVQCIAKSGEATFSNMPCAIDADTVLVPLKKMTTADKSKMVLQTEKFVAAEKARSVASANRPPTKRGLLLDDTTLQSARSLTVAMDSTPVLERRRTMATLAVYP
ncbi:MAG TPA: hypothetical protein VGU61_06790 [Noviherbaspirillum sp.]|jgi:hypothetical protein|uniref:hypothetical protein n=1 Tax=Noviherbaspirillum sp. TaxID=1926288 RepID=UPI002DDCB850|nr:hypothetical protein [Noviherbaspirillum sp.]HEV2609956.1 hypothetical protein [Noviherbaspirillum sp.]